MLPDDPLVFEFSAEICKLEANLEGYLTQREFLAPVAFSACMSLAMRTAHKAGLTLPELHTAIDAWWKARHSVPVRLR